MSEQKVFGELLRDLRLNRSISQEKLSEITGLDRSFISLIERGERTPTLTTIIKISKAFGLKPSQLLSEYEDRLEKLSDGEHDDN